MVHSTEIMAPTLSPRSDAIQVPDNHQLPRSTIAYISAGAGVGLVLISILIGVIIRSSRRKSRIRERRKTKQAQRDKLQALNGKYEYQPSYSMKPVPTEKESSPDTPKRPAPPVERWKWNPPGDPERTTATIQIPPNVKFF
jgi:hypothetical protein